jgi:HD-like signal output (HDOD) protein
MAGTAIPKPQEIHAKVTRLIGTLSGLPTTVGVAVRLFQLERGEDAIPAEYARVIASDAGLAGRILAVANSPYYGHAMRITRPLVAVNMLGIAAIRTLAVNFCLSGLHHELRLNPEASQKLWKASLCKAVAAREIARGLDPAVAEEAYLAGLFQDIAIPVMLAAAEEQVSTLLDQRMNTTWRLQAELSAMGADHMAFGSKLALQLKLPTSLALLVATHHNPQALREAAPAPLASAVYAAA